MIKENIYAWLYHYNSVIASCLCPNAFVPSSHIGNYMIGSNLVITRSAQDQDKCRQSKLVINRSAQDQDKCCQSKLLFIMTLMLTYIAMSASASYLLTVTALYNFMKLFCRICMMSLAIACSQTTSMSMSFLFSSRECLALSMPR